MRKTAQFTATDGRDNGKKFLITEMPASKAERWAMRAFMAIGSTGAEIPDDVAAMGFAGIAQAGMEWLCRVPFEIAEPLLDEMMTCVQAMPDPNNANVVRSLVEDDIEEVKTRLRLRLETFKLHADFLQAAAPSTSDQTPATAGRKRG